MIKFSTTIAFGFISILSSPAIAGEVYITGSGGISSSSHSIERDLGENPPTLPAPDAGGVSTATEDGASFSIGAGYRSNIGDGPLFVAVEGSYTFEDISSRNINGVLVTDIDIDSQYGGRLMFGSEVSDTVSLYAHGGVSFVEFDISNSYTFAPPVRDRSETEAAFAFGAGAQFNVTEKAGLFFEYTRLTEIEFDGIPEVAGDTGRVNPNDLSLDRFSVGVRWAL